MVAETDNFVKQKSTTTGTGDFTLSDLSPARRSFNTAFGTGGTDVFQYAIFHQGNNQYEFGTGHLSDSTTLVRDTVEDSSNGDSLVDFTSGDKIVLCDIPAGKYGPALDLADDDNNESSRIQEIATQNDPDSIATEPSADKVLFDFSGLLSTDNLYHIRDEKSSGTDGGSSNNGSRQTRDLNTEAVSNISSASLSSNTVTLPSGTYFLFAHAPGQFTGQHVAIWRNTSDGSDTLVGTSERCKQGGSTNVTTHSVIRGQFTIGSSKNFELKHYTSTANSSNGLGFSTPDSSKEVYSEVMIWKVT